MSKLTKDQADDLYDRALSHLASDLRHLAADVERLGKTYQPMPGRAHDPKLTRVWAASEVHNKVLSWLGQHNGALLGLWWAAVEAEHATARSTPAELIDHAATALEAAAGEGVWEAGESEKWADVALRGAGVIR